MKKIFTAALTGVFLCTALQSSPAQAFSLDFFSALFRKAESPPEKIAREVTRGLKDDRDKVTALFNWITDNIQYDVVAFNSGQYPEQTTEETLRRKIGVCDDFALLFQEMASAVGIQSRIVSGLVYSPASPEGLSEHSWNLVQLGDKALIVDTTWGAGVFDHETRLYTRKRDTHYLLAAPARLRFTHLQTDSKEEAQVVDGVGIDQFRQAHPNTRMLNKLGLNPVDLAQYVRTSREGQLPKVHQAIDPNIELVRAPLKRPVTGTVLQVEVTHSEQTRMHVLWDGKYLEFQRAAPHLSKMSFEVEDDKTISILYQMPDGRYYRLIEY